MSSWRTDFFNEMLNFLYITSIQVAWTAEVLVHTSDF